MYNNLVQPLVPFPSRASTTLIPPARAFTWYTVRGFYPSSPALFQKKKITGSIAPTIPVFWSRWVPALTRLMGNWPPDQSRKDRHYLRCKVVWQKDNPASSPAPCTTRQRYPHHVFGCTQTWEYTSLTLFTQHHRTHWALTPHSPRSSLITPPDLKNLCGEWAWLQITMTWSRDTRRVTEGRNRMNVWDVTRALGKDALARHEGFPRRPKVHCTS
jgi:hypothetical protein